jgi:hypothetical protein
MHSAADIVKDPPRLHILFDDLVNQEMKSMTKTVGLTAK